MHNNRTWKECWHQLSAVRVNDFHFIKPLLKYTYLNTHMHCISRVSRLPCLFSISNYHHPNMLVRQAKSSSTQSYQSSSGIPSTPQSLSTYFISLDPNNTVFTINIPDYTNLPPLITNLTSFNPNIYLSSVFFFLYLATNHLFLHPICI